MDDRLEHTLIHVHCPRCDGAYDVPASVVAESQRLVEHGCPGTSSCECPASFYASLIEPAALEALAHEESDPC